MSFQREFKLNEMVAFCQVHIIKNWRREEEKTTNFDDIYCQLSDTLLIILKNHLMKGI